ncbi:MAG: LysR substrate-binding domain-containing protein, partial [Hylemonella sp.]
GLGLAIGPQLCAAPAAGAPGRELRYLPLDGRAPARRVVLAWRRSYSRQPALQALLDALRDCELPGVRPVEDGPIETG